MKRALLVGIDDYPGKSMDLKSSVNDIDKWASLLMDRYEFKREHIRLLVNERAKKPEVIQRLKWLRSGARRGDVLVFVFSGHGTTFTERDEYGFLDEAKDEALCLHGSRAEDLLIDDELSVIFSNLTPDVNLTIICDSCFSGGMDDPLAVKDDFDKLVNYKYSPLSLDLEHRNDPKSPKRKFGYCLSQKEGIKVSKGQHTVGLRSLLLAACRETEPAQVNNQATEGLSVFTFYATRVLFSSTQPITAQELIDRVIDDIKDAGGSQTPQLKGREDLFNKPLFAKSNL
jgi:hypothetical protein